MEAVILRKKTLKAKLGVGKYTNTTVEDVLEIEPSYLEWVYFSLSRITFTDDILDRLGITEEYRIEKPGANMEMRKQFRNKRRNDWVNKAETTEEQKLRWYKIHAIVKKKRRIIDKRAAFLGEIRDRHEQSAGRLAWKNQGH